MNEVFQKAMKRSSEEFDELIIEAEKLCDRRNTEALELIERARHIARESGDIKHLTLVNYIQAYYDCIVSNNYEKAIDRLNDSLSRLDEEEVAAMGYKLLMTLGNAYQLKGDLFSAQESYLRGLKGLESKPKLNQSEEDFLAAFYYNLSALLSSSEWKLETEDYLEKAIAIYAEQDKKFKLSKCYTAYASIFEGKEDYHKAVLFLNKALALDEEMNDEYSIALSKANLGILSVKINDHDQSLSYLNDALEFYETNNRTFETGMVKFELGQAYIHAGDLELGLENVSKAEEIMFFLNNKKELSEIYRVKSKALAQKGNHDEAFYYQEKYIDCLKFFFDNEKNNALLRARKEFESERKEKEAKLLREKNEEIKSYVQKLEFSNNELKQFANAASHDLREPLRVINNYSFLLQKSLSDHLTEQQTEFLNFILDGCKRMDHLIKDLLRLAKVDSDPNVERVKLTNVIEEVKLNLDALIKEKNAMIVVGEMPLILADRTQMIVLFQNLIANGIKYNKSETPTIKIKFVEEKSYVDILVSDNGIGIPENLREAAFEIFRRLHKFTDISGSGIGLPMCKKVVESMNGKIKIEDRPGGGSIFRITFNKSIVKPVFK